MTSGLADLGRFLLSIISCNPDRAATTATLGLLLTGDFLFLGVVRALLCRKGGVLSRRGGEGGRVATRPARERGAGLGGLGCFFGGDARLEVG